MTPELLELADRLAGLVRLPWGEYDDARQEARLALLEAERAYRPELGVPLEGFAALVIRRRLNTALKLQLRGKHRLLTGALRSVVTEEGERFEALELVGDRRGDVLELVAQREQLARILAALPSLTRLERETLASSLAGTAAAPQSKQADNALQRARAKLRAA